MWTYIRTHAHAHATHTTTRNKCANIDVIHGFSITLSVHTASPYSKPILSISLRYLYSIAIAHMSVSHIYLWFDVCMCARVSVCECVYRVPLDSESIQCKVCVEMSAQIMRSCFNVAVVIHQQKLEFVQGYVVLAYVIDNFYVYMCIRSVTLESITR